MNHNASLVMDEKMKEDWLELVACPACRNSLSFDNGSDLSLVCQGCGDQYALQDRIPVLVPEKDLKRLSDFSQAYSRMRLDEGWRPISAEQALELPFTRPKGYPRVYWEVRQQSYTTFINFLTEHGPSPPMGPAVELGTGNGWLSYNLAKSGYRVIALDANIDENFGLGAAKIYLNQADFALVQGDLNRPPLPDNKFGLVIFNASLHYARDLASTLNRTKQVLLPKGRVVIMDSPVAEKPRPASTVGDRICGSQELQDALDRAGLQAQWLPVRRGASWWIEQGLRLARGDSRFSLPLIVAKKV